jgi:hypothetical protein
MQQRSEQDCCRCSSRQKDVRDSIETSIAIGMVWRERESDFKKKSKILNVRKGKTFDGTFDGMVWSRVVCLETKQRRIQQYEIVTSGDVGTRNQGQMIRVGHWRRLLESGLNFRN